MCYLTIPQSKSSDIAKLDLNSAFTDTSAAKSLTWLVTGSSSGFGFSLIHIILSDVHNMIALSPNPARTPDPV